MHGIKRSGKESPRYQKYHSQSTIELLKIAAIENRKNKIACPHCNRLSDKQNISRWHFDNCKLSPNYQEKITWGRVCRLSDRKEMDAGNWSIYIKSFIHSE
jgi:hypothetical protein